MYLWFAFSGSCKFKTMCGVVENFNLDVPKDSLFLTEKEEKDIDLLKNQVKMEKEHAEQLEKSIHQLGDQIVVFFFTFCDVCIEYAMFFGAVENNGFSGTKHLI